MKPYELPEECRSTPPMLEWMKENIGCPPCVIAVAVPWYVDALKENGEAAAASALSKFAQDERNGPSEVAQEMDRLKTEVDLGLATYLKELDCTVQCNAVEEPT